MTHVTTALPPHVNAASFPAARGLLRFITCGSVDDGKSTLIGRLLADTGNIADDQAAGLAADSRRFGTQAGEVDYALLLDGLAAEREQGITIDVAYRYFATERRSFIVADTPGHRQYTRNMATGASRADLAVVLVDARHGVVEQTRRHTLIVCLLGVRDIVLAVNKMDLVGYEQARFAAIEAEYRAFAAAVGQAPLRVTAIPLSARNAQNVTTPSDRMAWWRGPSLLAHLETVPLPAEATAAAMRMPVQLALRPDAEFRGYAGLVTGGPVAVGDKVVVLPSGQTSSVARIATADGDLPRAQAGQSVSLVLADPLDVARGDMIAAASHPPQVGNRIEAQVLWSSEAELDPAREYLLKLGTASVPAHVDPPSVGIDVATGGAIAIETLGLNGLATLSISLDRAVAADSYAGNRQTGGFILIDRASNETVALGLVLAVSKAKWLAGMPRLPPARERAWRSLAKAVSWRIVGTLETFGLAWLFTGSVSIAASIGTVEIATKIALYYTHERGWARVRLGLVRDKS